MVTKPDDYFLFLDRQNRDNKLNIPRQWLGLVSEFPDLTSEEAKTIFNLWLHKGEQNAIYSRGAGNNIGGIVENKTEATVIKFCSSIKAFSGRIRSMVA